MYTTYNVSTSIDLTIDIALKASLLGEGSSTTYLIETLNVV
jgi:hypothetical protein